VVARYDNEELSCLALALDCHGSQSPLLDISWRESWAEGLVTAQDVWEAAVDELDLQTD
jgi:hypothetical protein